jgi:hypothetical protein
MILFGVSCAFILLSSILRLDELFAAPKKRVKHRRAAFLLDRDGEPVLCDPDGHTWSRPARRR